MKITHLWIEQFKNLHNFKISFDKGCLTSVLVGRNGTGKSNLLEAIILIFRDLDFGESPSFTYKIEYSCRNSYINIDADHRRAKDPLIIFVDGQAVLPKDFSRKAGGHYLPSYIFGYYSGPSNRMEKHFERHQYLFAEELLSGVNIPLRPMLYARLVYSQFVLLSFFDGKSEEDSDREFLKKYLRIEDLESVLFVLKRPYWYNSHRRSHQNDPGDERFWNARGVVRDFLIKLYDLSLAPLRLYHKGSKGASRDNLYLFIKNKQDLINLATEYTDRQELFKAFESMNISDLVEDVRTRVKIRGMRGSLTFRELSEGEQQLLMVLGLLRFIKGEEALFLLDEPDTHLNPAWSLEYVRLLNQAIEDPDTSQVIMATHDPLVVASLVRTEVQLMQRDAKGVVGAKHPDESPKGMGVAALLTSEIYGLRSELDLDTLEQLDRKRILAIKDELNDAERRELADLDEILGNLDFTKTVRDPLYKLFVEAMTAVEKVKGLNIPVLSATQKQEQLTEAVKIALRLKADE